MEGQPMRSLKSIFKLNALCSGHILLLGSGVRTQTSSEALSVHMVILPPGRTVGEGTHSASGRTVTLSLLHRHNDNLSDAQCSGWA